MHSDNNGITRKLWPAIIALALLLTCGVASAAAKNPAELLEKGIYTEEMVGDLGAAIDIYTEITEQSAANRPLIAQAFFRLGLCHLKQGEDDEARSAFQKVVEDFSDQGQLAAKAREHLLSLQTTPLISPAPWQDGEHLEYDIKLPTGRTLGFLRTTIRSAVVDGVDAWHFETRRFIFSGPDNYGVSRVHAERDTLLPINSEFRNRTLGYADATYSRDSVTIKSAGETRLDDTSGVFDNEQSVALIRTLPLEPGFKTRLRFLPIWTQTILDVDLEVTKRETCEVPAGKFECDVVELSVEDQTFWYSTGPERHLVRLKAGGAIIELAKIGHAPPAAPTSFGMEDFDFTATVPTGWLTQEYQPRTHRAVVRLLDPDAYSLSSIEIDHCPRRGCPGLQENAERELKGAQERFENFTMRPGSWQERQLDGRPAISFVSDFQNGSEVWVQYRIYTFTKTTRFEFIFRTSAERFEEMKDDFDSILDSLRAE